MFEGSVEEFRLRLPFEVLLRGFCLGVPLGFYRKLGGWGFRGWGF